MVVRVALGMVVIVPEKKQYKQHPQHPTVDGNDCNHSHNRVCVLFFLEKIANEKQHRSLR